MTVTYASRAGAERRAGALNKLGICPGIIAQADGRFRLTHDPEDTTTVSVLDPTDDGQDES